MSRTQRWLRALRSYLSDVFYSMTVLTVVSVVGFYLHYSGGKFDGVPFKQIEYDLIFVAAVMVITALVFPLVRRYIQWRKTHWPGGGGPGRRLRRDDPYR